MAATTVVPDASTDAAPAVPALPAGSPIVPTLSLPPPPEDRLPYNWRLRTEGLPALSADGRLAVVVVDEPDGGRGYPSNQLVFLSVDRDSVDKKLPLLVADEFNTEGATISSADAKVIERKIGRRLELARTELAKTTWVSLAHIDPASTPPKSKGEWGPIAGVDVSLAPGRLRVRDASSAILLDRDVRAWTLPSYKIRDFDPCKFEPTPTLIAVDPSRHALVVVVTQTLVGGGDQCNSPNDAHAVRFKP